MQWDWGNKETNKLLYNGASCVLAMLTHFWGWVGDGARNSPWGVKECCIEQIYFWILIGRREGK